MPNTLPKNLALLGLLWASGCLSIEAIPRAPEDAGPCARGECAPDGAEPDAGRGAIDPGPTDLGPDPVDADAGDTEPAPGALGRTCLDGEPPEGLTGHPQVCASGLRCEHGRCASEERQSLPCPAPPTYPIGCMPVPSGPQEGVAPTAWAPAEDALYWWEPGALDSRGNYDHGGAIARMRYDVWEREVLASGLELFDNTTRRFIEPLLLVKDGYVVWGWGGQAFAVPTDRPGAAPIALPDNPENWCFSATAAYHGAGGAAFRIPLGQAGAPQEQLVPASAGFGSGPCFVSAHHLVAANGVSVVLADEGDARVSDETPKARLVYMDDEQVVSQLPDGYIGRAVRDAQGGLGELVSVAGPGMFVAVDGGDVVWAGGAERDKCFVARSRLDARTDPRWAASIPCYPVVSGGAQGVVLLRMTGHNRWSTNGYYPLVAVDAP